MPYQVIFRVLFFFQLRISLFIPLKCIHLSVQSRISWAWCRLLMPRFASLLSWFTPSTRHMATQAIMQQQLPIMSVWCVGRNYAEHIKELGNQSADGSLPPYPMIFLKSGGSVLASGRDLVLPSWSKDVHHEVRQGLPSCMPCMPSPPMMHE